MGNEQGLDDPKKKAKQVSDWGEEVTSIAPSLKHATPVDDWGEDVVTEKKNGTLPSTEPTNGSPVATSPLPLADGGKGVTRDRFQIPQNVVTKDGAVLNVPATAFMTTEQFNGLQNRVSSETVLPQDVELSSCTLEINVCASSCNA